MGPGVPGTGVPGTGVPGTGVRGDYALKLIWIFPPKLKFQDRDPPGIWLKFWEARPSSLLPPRLKSDLYTARLLLLAVKSLIILPHWIPLLSEFSEPDPMFAASDSSAYDAWNWTHILITCFLSEVTNKRWLFFPHLSEHAAKQQVVSLRISVLLCPGAWGSRVKIGGENGNLTVSQNCCCNTKLIGGKHRDAKTVLSDWECLIQ